MSRSMPYWYEANSTIFEVGAAAADAGDDETLADCLAEFERRSSRFSIPWQQKLVQYVADSRPTWLALAVFAASLVQPQKAGDKSVYVVLLRGANGGDGFSAYVGMTGLTPEERFANHKAGVKCGRGWVRDFGLRLLPEVYQHLVGIAYEDAVRIEQQLAGWFRACGIETYGGH